MNKEMENELVSDAYGVRIYAAFFKFCPERLANYAEFEHVVLSNDDINEFDLDDLVDKPKDVDVYGNDNEQADKYGVELATFSSNVPSDEESSLSTEFDFVFVSDDDFDDVVVNTQECE